MAKVPSDKLHRLIRRLTRQEKRYFRLFLRGKPERDAKYRQLFDALAAMEVFDEQALKRVVYGDTPPESKKYSELKGYLYQLVLKSLQAYDDRQSVEARLNNYLEGVALLFRRGFYDDCGDLLYKATRLARRYECFAHLLEIVRWEKQLAYTRMDADFLNKRLTQLEYAENQALEQLSNLTLYRQGFFQVYATVKREAQLQASRHYASIQALMAGPLFQDSDQALSHKARVYFYRTRNLFHYAVQDYPLFYETGRMLIELLESQPHFLREQLSDYIAALSNFILSCGLLGKYEEVRVALKKLDEVAPLTEDDRRKKHRQYFSNLFVLCLYTGDFDTARREMARCQEEATAFDPHDYETASFYFQYCCICFGYGDYNSALDYLNEWMSQPRTVEREDLQSLARILSLLLHFEMDNLMLIESLLRSATRFLQKKNRLFDLERRFFHFMGELLRAPNARERIPAFRKMRADLDELTQHAGAQSLLQTFDLEAWLDSKIHGFTFGEAVRAKRARERAAGEQAD